MRNDEHILVAGSGIAGLGAALAFGGGTCRVTILDRDPPPPAGSAEEAFYSWERRGATQLRHSHAFLGRLTTLIRERYPDLMAELLQEGTRLFGFEDGLTPTLAQGYVPSKGDEDLKLLFSRRTTLELILRRYAARQPGVTFVNDSGVRGLIARHEGGKLYVDGLKVERGGVVEDVRADVVVDATGRNTLFPDWLRAEGATIKEDSKPCGILYYTRHYKLRDGQDEPPRGGDAPAGGADLGYIKFGVFIADNRHFSITVAVPEIESTLRTAIVKPENFDAACMAMPGSARWIDPVRADPVSRVFSMGELHNVWRHYVKDGIPQALNFFAIGDAAVRTNPLYGRGCSSGVVEAHLLRGALDSSDDPTERALAYEREITKAIRPYYDSMVQLDLQAIRRAEHERDPNYQPGLRARITKSFTEEGLMPASRGNVEVSRAMSRVFHMLDEPATMLRKPAVLMGVLSMWATSNAEKKRRGLYPAKAGPERADMMKLLNIAA